MSFHFRFDRELSFTFLACVRFVAVHANEMILQAVVGGQVALTAKIKFMKRVKVLNTYIFRRGVYLKTNNADFGVSLPPKSYFYDTTESEVFFLIMQ